MAMVGMAAMAVTAHHPISPPTRRNEAMDMPSRHDHAGHAHHHPPSAPTAEGLRDPVCGMTVTAQSEHRVEHAGRPYYFCSAKCQAKFVAEPARYSGEPVAPAPAEARTQAAGTIYTCPMHPEIRQ